MGMSWVRTLFRAQEGNGDGDGMNLAVAAPNLVEATATLAGMKPAGPDEPVRRDTVEMHLAAKVLGAHLANRYQTSYPLTLRLDALTDEEAETLMRLAADALASDGEPPPARRERAEELLRRLGAKPEHLDMVEAGLRRPTPLGALADAARAQDKAAHAYALALLTGAERSPTGIAYLGYLALRLGLSRETVGSLSRRYRG